MASKNDEMRFKILKSPEKNAVMKSKKKMPFEIEWSFGWKNEIGLINISKNNKLQTFFVSEHVGIILEYNATNKTKHLDMLTGHVCICVVWRTIIFEGNCLLHPWRNYISSFDSNTDRNLLVTADRGNDNSVIIVWDSFQRIPIFTLLSPYKMGTVIVKFSLDSRYLITVSVDTDGEQTVDLWDWTSPCLEKLFCSTKLDNSFGPIIHLTCSYDRPDFYCLTTKERIFFMTLEENEKKLTTIVPKQDPKQMEYNYTQSAYVTNFRQVVSASTGGLVTVWDDINYNKSKIKNTPVTNNKLLLKTVKLDDHCITTIFCQKNIITGNTNGDVYFYDKSLCVLYHLNQFIGDSITSIAMVNINDIGDEKGIPDAAATSVKDTKHAIEKFKNLYNNDNSKGRIGVAFTKTQEFECDPFFISTRNCKIFQINISENSYNQIYEQGEEEFITAMDVHPKKSCIILGNSIGTLSMYDFQTKKLIAKTVSNRTTEKFSQVTCIKFSYSGSHLCYGCANGSFWFIDHYVLTPMIKTPFKWNDEETSNVQNITFSKSSNYVVYTDDSFSMFLYGILPSKQFNVKYFGCSQVHTKTVRGISMTEYTSNLMIYSIGADHKIVILDFDKTKDEHPNLVKIIKIPSEHGPRCMMKSMAVKRPVNLIVSGSDSRITVWNDSRCIRTTSGVDLESPINVMKESSADKSIVFFCNDTDIGILRQPVDGNPYKNVAVHGSGTKLIDIGISRDGKYVFNISENSTSVLMWHVNTSYLDELEKKGGTGLNAYNFLIENGINGSEIKRLKQFFCLVQLKNSQDPEEVVVDQFVDVFEIPFIMMAMGYYPSETELVNMMYEMRTRDENKIGHSVTLMTFEETVILYLNYKPKSDLKFSDIRRAFDNMVLDDQSMYDEHREKMKKGQLTGKSFVHMLKNMGEKMSDNELEVVFRTLCKSTNGMSSSGRIESVVNFYDVLPATFTSQEIISNLLGFQE